MTSYDFLHLTFLAVGGEIRGRTKVQKTVYFLGVLSNLLPDLGFRPHFYGPYSDAISEALIKLKARDFLTESVHSAGAIGSRGFEIARHDFQLTEEGQKIAEQKAKANPVLWKKLQDVAARFKKAGDIDYMRMSVAAKTYFMLQNSGQPASLIQLSESAKELGWDATADDINESISFLERLGLVKREAKSKRTPGKGHDRQRA
jgi:uncharacterized protein YwgA